MNNRLGFTLVETITGIIIFGVISVSSWYAIDALFRSGEMSRDRNSAVNLLQKSQEELRNASKTFFMDLQNCQFPGPAMTGNYHNCGFKDITNTFSGYTRSLAVSLENGSTELKKATITVNWKIFGQDKSLQSVVLLARPPDPLPGNIYGKIVSTQNENVIIPNVSLKVRYNAGTTSDEKPAAPSSAALGNKGENYDFKKTDGTYDLKPGYWTLTATHANYKDYISPQPIRVEPSTETPYNFSMEPKLDNGHIQVKLINGLTGDPIVSFPYAYIAIQDDNIRFATTTQSTIKFAEPVNVTFNDNNPRQFTVFTWQTYMAGYVAPTNSQGGTNCVFAYSAQGWSSAVMQADGSLQCDHSFTGTKDTDRIVVNPGEDVLVTIPLVPVPEVRVHGRVVNSKEEPIKNATVVSLWPNGYQWRTSAITDEQGNYTLMVPAAQGFFPTNTKMRIRATGNVPVKGCCKQDGLEARIGEITADNLFPTQMDYNVADIKITGESYNCGNLEGHITDESGASPIFLDDVKINVKGIRNESNEQGYYIYQCADNGNAASEEGYRISSTGVAVFSASKEGYHTFTSNNGYSPIYNILPGGGISILENRLNIFDGKLWPWRRGTVKVKVTDGINPVSNLQVKLDGTGYDNYSKTIQTDNNGEAVFTDILESWPPPDLPPTDNFYRRAIKGHTVTITDPSKMYLNPDPIPLTDIRFGQIRLVPVRVTTGGGA